LTDAIVTPVLHWVQLHPGWSQMVVFLIALGESLAMVGLFVPGTVLMFGIGAVVATGSLAPWPTLGAAVAGAMAGDGISYLLGRHYHEGLARLWPFSRRPQWLQSSRAFFERHGGKSVLFGRFVGPMRPVVPMVAGMLSMPAGRFFLVNLISAALWAPAYLVPGILFGASVGLASEIATRLAVLLVGTVVVLWLIGWLVHRLYVYLQPRAGRAIGAMLRWGARHPLLGGLTAAVLDPEHPEPRGLSVLALVLLSTAWAFATIVHAVARPSSLVYMDSAVSHAMRNLRSPWSDHVMVAVTSLGGPWALLGLALAIAAWLGWRHHWSALGHWLAAATFASGAPLLLSHLVPTEAWPGAVRGSFPSGHTLRGTVLYGLLAVLTARELRPAWRWRAYAAAAVLVGAIALSRLYLGAERLSDVLGGLTLGLAWVALLGMAYRRHPAATVSPRGLLAVLGATLLLAGSWHLMYLHRSDMGRYALVHRPTYLDTQAWWGGRWQELADYRRDLEGGRKQPLTLQWAAPLPDVEALLRRLGWTRPVPLTAASLLRLLSADSPPSQVPVPPQVHDGRHEALVLVRPTADPRRREVLRLWPSDVHLQKPEAPLWLGNVSYQKLTRPLSLVLIPRTQLQFDAPLAELSRTLAGVRHTLVHRRPLTTEEAPEWDGGVMLVRGAGG